MCLSFTVSLSFNCQWVNMIMNLCHSRNDNFSFYFNMSLQELTLKMSFFTLKCWVLEVLTLSSITGVGDKIISPWCVLLALQSVLQFHSCHWLEFCGDLLWKCYGQLFLSNALVKILFFLNSWKHLGFWWWVKNILSSMYSVSPCREQSSPCWRAATLLHFQMSLV